MVQLRSYEVLHLVDCGASIIPPALACRFSLNLASEHESGTHAHSVQHVDHTLLLVGLLLNQRLTPRLKSEDVLLDLFSITLDSGLIAAELEEGLHGILL